MDYEKLAISLETQENILAAIGNLGVQIAHTSSNIVLPDETDRVFYDVARASEAILITGNIRHYPNEPFIQTPADFLLAF
jgi:predicted nucleic acid-binding protein